MGPLHRDGKKIQPGHSFLLDFNMPEATVFNILIVIIIHCDMIETLEQYKLLDRKNSLFVSDIFKYNDEIC